MKRKSREKSVIYGDLDLPLAFATVVLAVFGLFAVYSATRTFGTYTSIIVQAAAVLIGFGVMLALSFFDYEQFIPIIKYIFVASVVLLILVLLIGMTGIWGSKSWIKIGGLSVQPSELVKCGFIITLAYHLSRAKEKINEIPVLMGLLLHLAIPVVLIFLQPDFGTAIVFVVVFAVMLFSAKLSPKYIFAVIGLSAVGAPVMYHYLSDYQKNRINVFLNPELDPTGSGYNVVQSKIALGSGGFSGNGYLQGASTQMGYLPAKHTDFIFSSIAEELGFMGAAFVIIALFVIILRVIRIARKADNLFGRYICVGVAAMMFFHSFENIGMCMGIMPVTGIPLPFVSYGGTSIITNFACIGMVLSVAYHNKPRGIFQVH